MALFDYMETLQGFLRDRTQRTWSPEDLRRYINRARRDIAMRSQCIRIVPPTSGSISTIQVTNPGNHYTAPVVTISAPDLPHGTVNFPAGEQATAIATQVSSVITNVSVINGGTGYFQPTATISDPTGSGAKLTVQTTPTSITTTAQERYDFSNFPISTFAGVGAVYAVLNVSILYSNLRYRLLRYPFSQYQAYIRNYPFQYSYVPVVYSQYGDGVNAALLMYPFPSQAYAFEADCLCIPSDLQSDQDFEAIGAPWTEAVPYLAAHFAYMEAQSFNNARFWQDQYNMWLTRLSGYARPGLSVSPYGRA